MHMAAYGVNEDGFPSQNRLQAQVLQPLILRCSWWVNYCRKSPSAARWQNSEDQQELSLLQMLLWWEMSRRPVGFSCFGLKLVWSLEDKRQQEMSPGQHKSFWTLMSRFVPGIRVPRSWHFTVCTPHPSHPPACLCPETHTRSLVCLRLSSCVPSALHLP